MSKGVNKTGGVPGDGARCYVYVLRDPRDGSVFLVGRGRGTRPEPDGRFENVASHDEQTLARLSAIEDHGLQAEQIILADHLASETDAATVERAVRAAYHAARITPTNLVGAAHSGGPATFGDRPPSPEGFLDGDHRPRLEELVLQQDSEITRLNDALGRVRALRDLAQWAGQTVDGGMNGATVGVGDLSRALD